MIFPKLSDWGSPAVVERKLKETLREEIGALGAKKDITESDVIEAIEAYTQKHGKMPTKLCGTFAQIYPATKFFNYSTSREKDGFLTPFGMVSLHLDTKAVGWYLAGDE